MELVPYQASGYISYSLRITYRQLVDAFEDQKNQIYLDSNKFLAIDLGVSNFVTCADGVNSFIIDGKILLSKLRLFNKTTAKLKAILDRQKLKTYKRLHKLYRYKKNYINDFVHK